MTNTVESVLKELENQELTIKILFKKVNKKATYPFDILTNAVLDRSLHLIFGFSSLIRNENYIAAAHLVRCHLDNIIRYSAAWLVENPQKFALDILKGMKISEIKDKMNQPLKDWYLKNKLNERYPWISNVYKETSGYIHLSNKHIFSSSTLNEEGEPAIEFSLSKKDNFVTDEARIEATECMIEINEILFEYVEKWIESKKIIENE